MGAIRSSAREHHFFDRDGIGGKSVSSAQGPRYEDMPYGGLGPFAPLAVLGSHSAGVIDSFAGFADRFF